MDERTLVPTRQFIRACRQMPKLLKFADSTGVELSGSQALLRSLVFRRIFRQRLASDEQNVGLLMPTSAYGAIANLGLSLDRRTTVNLNYTFSQETINYCIRHAGVKHIVTSRRVLERFPDLKLDAEFLVMEDLGQTVSLTDKISAFVDAFLTPISLLEWKLGLGNIPLDDVLTIIFTSGSTGTPKGAMITHRGVAANVKAFNDLLALQPGEKVLGALPLFHAFGYTVTFWLPAMDLGVSGIYHFNPLDPKKVGEMARKYRCLALPSTPTFLRGLLRRCPKEDFEHTSIVIGGAEKLPIDLIEAWDAKFGHRPVEGYGATELTPVVCVNVPIGRRPDYESWRKEGTIGRPFPELQARVVDPEADEIHILPPNTPGMLQIKGPSVMKGYYKEPEKTAAVLKDGWYTTGDIAEIDTDGFIRITGRQSRISKIGGEMVPHVLIEEAIDEILREAGNVDVEKEGIAVAVAAVPDERKGERLIIFHTGLSQTPDEVCKLLQKKGLPNLWIPSPADFHQVETIPLLGTGKLDLRAVKELAAKTARL